MDNTLLKDKKISLVVFLLLAVITLFFVVKFINEIKSSKYIGSDSQYSSLIYVNGEGEVKAIPDIATLSLTVSKEATTAKEAQDLLNETVAKVLGYLTDQGIEDKDVKSEYGGLNPKYSYEKEVCYTYPCPPREPKIVGYTATQSVSVKVRNVDNSNQIRTGLSDLGLTNISGPTFSIDDEDIYKEQARALAIKDAKEKAEILAADLGVKLSGIINFSENSLNGYYPVAYKSEMAGAAMDSSFPAPELPKGESTISSNVTITYKIK